jgi:hypothetical protein
MGERGRKGEKKDKRQKDKDKSGGGIVEELKR